MIRSVAGVRLQGAVFNSQPDPNVASNMEYLRGSSDFCRVHRPEGEVIWSGEECNWERSQPEVQLFPLRGQIRARLLQLDTIDSIG